MWKTLLTTCVLMCITVLKSWGQSEWTEWRQDVSTEEDVADWREIYEDLSDLAEHPFNINTITKEQLEQLPFLSDKMIEHILYYVYKYGPLLTEKELLGIEDMDRRTRRFLQDFIYIGPPDNEPDKLSLKRLLKYNKQEFSTRVDFPLNQKAGYADYSAETLSRYPNRKYSGDPFYHNFRYKFDYDHRISFGLTGEKDAGEPFFCKYNRKGYDFYSGYLFLQNIGCVKALALGHYKASFGYGLVFNTGGFFLGKYNLDLAVHRFGRGFSKYTSTNESKALQGGGVTFRLKDWELSACYSYRALDGRVENMFIRSFKTDGYHRTPGEVEKKNTIHNQLAACDIAYNRNKFQLGATLVYTHFNRVLNPELKPYNKFYPRGEDFLNVGVRYKYYFARFIFSGETAVDKDGRVAALHILSYSPSVHTSLFFINRFFDKRYQAIYSYSSFAENSRMQNELGNYIGLNTSLFDRKLKLTSYVDIFHFFWRRYQVDKEHTTGFDMRAEASYSPNNKLQMLIKYSLKDKPENYTEANKEKYVLPYVRHRLSGRLSYAPHEKVLLKTDIQYIRAGATGHEQSDGWMCSGTARIGFGRLPLRLSVLGAWFHTADYASRVYLSEPGLLYSFSVPSFYGKGQRCALKAEYEIGSRIQLQAKWGYTHYTDRESIGSGTEEIQGNQKSDIQVLLRLKW